MPNRNWLLAVALLAVVVASVLAVSLRQGSGVVAQPPSVDERLDDVQDELARLRSGMRGVQADLRLALSELRELRGDVAVLNERAQRLNRANRPEPSDAAAFTQTFVQEAIDRYERDGRAAAIAYYNSEESVDGQWYMFIIDAHDVMIAHQNPDLRGMNANSIVGPDNYPAGRMVQEVATEDGAWVDYQFTNLETGAVQVKHSWAVRHDGMTFGSGWYEEGPSKLHAPGAYTQSYVERALELYRVLGRRALLEYYNSEESVDDEWYLFVIEEDGNRVVHAFEPLGVNVLDGGPDPTGYDFRTAIVEVEDQGWISYVFTHTESRELERKHTWLVRRDGLIFGSGYYLEGEFQPAEAE